MFNYLLKYSTRIINSYAELFLQPNYCLDYKRVSQRTLNQPFRFLHETSAQYCSSSSIPRAEFQDKKETKAVDSSDDEDYQKTKDEKDRMEEAILYCGMSNIPLANCIARELGMELGNIVCHFDCHGETKFQYQNSLRGRNVYIIQSTSPPVNENLMELYLMITAARRSSANNITVIMPYFGYARQDSKLNSRIPISAADVARMLETAGVDRLVSIDFHNAQIQGFFGPSVPCDNVQAQNIAAKYFAKKSFTNLVVVSPDARGTHRARNFQKCLLDHNVPANDFAVVVQEIKKSSRVKKRDFVGCVRGCDVVLVDDIIDSGRTICEAADYLRQHGAHKIYVFATHGLFSDDALKKIQKSPITEIVIMDTVLQSPHVLRCKKIKQLSVAKLLANAIQSIQKKDPDENFLTTDCENQKASDLGFKDE